MSRGRRPDRRGSEYGTCRNCGGQIRWARMVDSGRAVALDPMPVEGGTVELYQGQATIVPPGRGVLHQMHFTSCPVRVRTHA